MAEAIHDAYFGVLEDDGIDSWVGGIDLRPGQRVEVALYHDPDETTLELVLSVGSETFERVRHREAEYRRWTAERLQTARFNQDAPMTAPAIFACLSVHRVDLYPDGSAGIHWNDQGVLFQNRATAYTFVDPSGVCARAGWV